MCNSIDERSRYRLQEILESIEYIQQWSSMINAPDDFLTTMDGVMRFNACVMRLQVIGENVGKLMKSIPEILEMHNEIPWKAVYDMRNFISHEYSNLDETLIFDTIKNDLPVLKSIISTL